MELTRKNIIVLNKNWNKNPGSKDADYKGDMRVDIDFNYLLKIFDEPTDIETKIAKLKKEVDILNNGIHRSVSLWNNVDRKGRHFLSGNVNIPFVSARPKKQPKEKIKKTPDSYKQSGDSGENAPF